MVPATQILTERFEEVPAILLIRNLMMMFVIKVISVQAILDKSEGSYMNGLFLVWERGKGLDACVLLLQPVGFCKKD